MFDDNIRPFPVRRYDPNRGQHIDYGTLGHPGTYRTARETMQLFSETREAVAAAADEPTRLVLFDVLVERIAYDLPAYLDGWGGTPLHPTTHVAALYETERSATWLAGLRFLVHEPTLQLPQLLDEGRGLGDLVARHKIFQNWTHRQLLRRLSAEARWS